MSEPSHGSLPPKDWEPFFQKAGVRVEELIACKSSRSKAIKIGLFFSTLVGREVPIQVMERTGTAVLRIETGRAKEKRYYFEVRWDTPSTEKNLEADRITPKSKKPSGTKRNSKATARRQGKRKGERQRGASSKKSPTAKAAPNNPKPRKDARKSERAGNEEKW